MLNNKIHLLYILLLILSYNTFSQDYVSDTLAVRAILDSNGLYDITVDSVTDSAGGRISKLILWRFHISALPPEIGQLEMLSELDCGNHSLTYVTPEIGQLVNLEILKLYIPLNKTKYENTKLPTLPPEIGNCIKIKILVLCNNGLETLPGQIVNLKPTDECSFEENCLDSTIMPDSVIAWLDTYNPDWAKYQHVQPYIKSATASDNQNIVAGIDNDDYILISFSHVMKPTPDITSENIDTLLPLSNGHSWLDGLGSLGTVQWDQICKKVAIEMSTFVSSPTIEVGDTVRYTSIGKPIIIDGSFGPISIESENIKNKLNNLIIATHKGNNVISIHYSVTIPGKVTFDLYNLLGKCIYRFSEDKPAGKHSIKVNTTAISSGSYLCRIKADGISACKKVMIVR